MTRKLFCTALILLFPAIAFAASAIPSDREVFEELYAQGLRALLPEPGAANEFAPGFAGGLTPAATLRTVTETVLSGRGYSIPDSLKENGCILTVTITEARSAVRKEGKVYRRLLSLTLHARGADRSGTVLFARKCERTFQDSIPRTALKRTDTGRWFSPEIKRNVLDDSPNIPRIASLLAISAALGIFAFRR